MIVGTWLARRIAALEFARAIVDNKGPATPSSRPAVVPHGRNDAFASACMLMPSL
jgi:hypothetical protein